MTAHKNRAGYVLVSYACKQGDHGTKCDEFLSIGLNAIVCHCDCHGPCGNAACEKREPQRKIRNKQICPNCHEQLPLAGTCGNCE
jgi:hypothetical protein